MYDAHRVLHKLLAILRTMVVKLSRQFSYSCYILQRILSTWTPRLMRSGVTNKNANSRHECREHCSNEPNVSPVAILPSLDSESGHSAQPHSVSQHSEHTRTTGGSLPDDVESNHVSVSIVTSLRDSAPPILKPMTASDVRRYSKKSQM
jgi:hypothetical protein